VTQKNMVYFNAKLASVMRDVVLTCFGVSPLWGGVTRDAVQTLVSVSLLWGV
jgi:hypothetical protein